MYATIVKDTWTRVDSLGIQGWKYFFLGHLNVAASKTAVVNVYGRGSGDANAVPLPRADTLAAAFDLSLASDASKPATVTLYPSQAVLALCGAFEIYVEEVSLTSGGGSAATYVVGPVA